MKLRDRIKELRRVPASELMPNPKNWRLHPEQQSDAMRGILSEVGIADAVIARETSHGLMLIDGHLRADIAGDTVLPVLVLDVTEEESDKLLATFDTVTGLADVDSDKLAGLLESIQFEASQLEKMLAEFSDEHCDGEPEPEVEDVEPQLDNAEELGKKWKTARGQLWVIEGDETHRLLCGDATDADDVARLIGDERAGLMNTDPPYGVAYANDDRPNPGVAKPRVAKPRVTNDSLSDEALQAFLERAFSAATEHALRANAGWYMWHAHLTQGYFAAAAAAANVVLHRQIIWVKPVLVFGRGQYHSKHETCFMGWVKGNQPPDYGKGNGERTQTTVWEVDSVSHVDRKEFNHSTPKPVGLFAIPIIKHLKQGEICYEPFAGSGPQFVAAEQLSRRCYGLEIEPKYCAVILQRMQDAGCKCTLS